MRVQRWQAAFANHIIAEEGESAKGSSRNYVAKNVGKKI